ncbi:hypothetical protein [uncultured Imperialibacter sp.]
MPDFKSFQGRLRQELIRPSVDEKVFNVIVSGNVEYAIPREGG